MTGDKDYKRVQLPKDLKRVEAVPRERVKYHREFDYDAALAQDFEENRASYVEVIMYGVPVKVKVEKDEGSEFYDPKQK